jgi:hypothetical protein
MDIDKIIDDECYEGIRDQDGWETLILTINIEYPKLAKKIIERLKAMQ